MVYPCTPYEPDPTLYYLFFYVLLCLFTFGTDKNPVLKYVLETGKKRFTLNYTELL